VYVICQSTAQGRAHSYDTIDQHDNRPDEEYGDDEVIYPLIYDIKWNGIWEILY